MGISDELKESLIKMETKWLHMIQSHYAENPKLKESRKEISDFVNELLAQRKNSKILINKAKLLLYCKIINYK